MRHYFFISTILLFLPLTIMARGGRTVVNINSGWLFHPGEVAEAVANNLNDSRWTAITLPHDFQIAQPWVEPSPDERPDNDDPAANIRSRLSARGFKEMGIGWYRYHLKPLAAWRGQRVLLDFGGIAYTGDVYLNGERIGGTDYGYVGFQIDITHKIRWDKDNVIAVKADTREPQNSRWYTGGGLFRGVRLIVTNPGIYFERHPLRITTRDNRYVNIAAEFSVRTRDRSVRMGVSIIDPMGHLIYTDTVEQRRITTARTWEARMPEIAIADPMLWDCDHPRLYHARVALIDNSGQVVDEVEERFGIRTVEFGPAFGMRLNGKKVLLKGIANHHGLGPLGAAAFPSAIEKRLRLLKDWGCNHVRTSHNPYSREFIELCDSLGLLVVDELYDKWTQQHTGGRVPFEALWQRDVPEWVRRDRNSPSVVLWSLGNELQQNADMPFNDFGVTMYRLMRTLILRYDSTRLTTVAMHPRYRNWATDSLPCDLARATDIQSYNYQYKYFSGDSRRFPWMTFYQSEVTMAGMGGNWFGMDLSKVIGGAYWGAIDYLGESQGWPAKGWTQGCFDITLEPKPKAWLMRSMFRPDEPTVHIAVIDRKGDQMWNGVQTGSDGMSDHWNHKDGTRLNLITYTNAEEVELIVNGKSLGRQRNDTLNADRRNQIRWNNVEYHPGYCEAIARTAGRIVARHRIETTGPAVRLVAEPDNKQWHADGNDLLFIRVYAVDKKGRRCYTAQQLLTISITDGATIQAVANGDMTSKESYSGTIAPITNNVRTAQRNLYNGMAQVILRAGDKATKPTLTVTAPGLKGVSLELSTNSQ